MSRVKIGEDISKFSHRKQLGQFGPPGDTHPKGYPYYAHEAFPWANIDKAWTTSGLFTHRERLGRKDWQRIIEGPRAKIIESVVKSYEAVMEWPPGTARQFAEKREKTLGIDSLITVPVTLREWDSFVNV